MNRYLDFANRTCGEAVTHSCLLFDCSGSMAKTDWQPTRLEGAIQAGLAFLDVKCRQFPDDYLALVGFGHSAHVVHPLANVHTHAVALRTSLQGLSTMGSTNMPEGLRRARDILTGKGPSIQARHSPVRPQWLGKLAKWVFQEPVGSIITQSASPVPAGEPFHVMRQVVLLSDGHSTSPRSSTKVARAMKSENIEIAVVGIAGGPAEIDEEELRAIASPDAHGRPQYCFIGDQKQLIAEFKRLANRIEPL